MGDLPILKHASKEVLAAGLLEASDAIDWAIKRIADLERQLAESEHDCQAAIENDIKHQLKLAEARADGERLRTLLLWVIREAVDDYWMEIQILTRTKKNQLDITNAEWIELFDAAREEG